MTPQERYARAAAILVKARDNEITDAEAVAQIDALNTEYLTAQRSPYYAFIDQFDQLRAVLRLSEGSTAQQVTMCDAIARLCMEYSQSLKGEGQ